MPNHKPKSKMKKYPAHLRRNAASAAPRVPRKAAVEPAPTSAIDKVKAFVPTAGGALGAAALGTLLAREDVHPRAASGLVIAAGLAAAALAEKTWQREAGFGAAAAGASQLALLWWDDREQKQADGKAKPRQAEALPPGALESAFERARRRLALDADEAERYSRAG